MKTRTTTRTVLSYFLVSFFLAAQLIPAKSLGADQPPVAPPSPPGLTARTRAACLQFFPAVRRTFQQATLAQAMILTGMSGLLIHNVMLQKQISEIRQREKAQKPALAISTDEGPSAGRFQKLYFQNGQGALIGRRKDREIARVVKEISTMPEEADRDAQVQNVRDQLETFADEDDTLKAMVPLLTLVSETKKLQILLENGLNPARDEQWIPLLAEEIKLRKALGTKNKSFSDNNLDREVIRQFLAAETAVPAGERAAHTSRTVELVQGLGGAFSSFPPGEIDGIYHRYSSSTESLDRAALLTLAGTLSSEKGQALFRKMFSEELLQDANSSFRQPHFALRLLLEKLDAGHYRLSPAEKSSIEYALNDPNEGVRAGAMEVISKTDPSRAAAMVLSELEKMDPGSMHGNNPAFTSMLQKLSDYLRSVPDGVDYDRLNKLKAKMPKEVQNFYVNAPGGGMSRPVGTEVAASLMIMPITEAMKKGDTEKANAALQMLQDELRNMTLLNYSTPLSDAQQAAFDKALSGAAPEIKKKFLQVAKKTMSNRFVDEKIVALIEAESKTPPGTAGRVLADALGDFAARTLLESSEAAKNKLKATVLAAAKGALAEDSVEVRAAAVRAIGAAGLPAGKEILMQKLKEAKGTDATKSPLEFGSLIHAIESFAKSNPTLVDSAEIKRLILEIPKEARFYNSYLTPDFYAGTAYTELRARVGLPPPQ